MAAGGVLGGLMGRFLSKGGDGGFHLPGALQDRSRILAIDTGDLSDLLFHVPLLRAVRERYPRSRIDIMLPAEHTPLVKESGFARNCLEYNRKQLRTWTPGYLGLAKSVRGQGYDMTVVMSYDPHPALENVALASGAPLRLGPSHGKSYPGVNFEVRHADLESTYRGARLAVTAPFLGLGEALSDRAWPLPPEKVRRTQQLVHFNKPRSDELLVGVDPSLGKAGAGLSLPNIQFLLNQLHSQLPCRAVPLCADLGDARLREFEAGLGQAPLDIPRDSLFSVVLLASLCDLFIAGNTDLFHFAAAQGVPTIGLFVKEDDATWEPHDHPNVHILRVKEGKRVEVDTLLEAVRAVRGGS